jgi:hypothetical protein
VEEWLLAVEERPLAVEEWLLAVEEWLLAVEERPRADERRRGERSRPAARWGRRQETSEVEVRRPAIQPAVEVVATLGSTRPPA